MGIHTSLWTCYPLRSQEYLSIEKVFSISIGNGVAKVVALDLKIYFIYFYSYCMKKIHLNFCCLFLPKKSGTLYSRHLVIADTFLGTAGVRYIQGWLYRKFKHIHVLFRHIHSCCGLFRIMCNSCKHSEPCHIQNPGIFRTQDIFRTLKAYSDIFRTMCNFIFIT